MLFLMTIISVIVSFLLGRLEPSVPRWGLEDRRDDTCVTPTQTVSAVPPNVNGVDPAKYLYDHQTRVYRKEDNIGYTPPVESTIETLKPSYYSGFFIVIFLLVLAFVVAIGETRMRMIGLLRGYHLQKQARIHLEQKLTQSEKDKTHLASNLRDIDQARIHLEHKLAQSEEDKAQQDSNLRDIDQARIHLEHKLAQSEEYKAQLDSNLWDIDQAQRAKEEKLNEALENAKELREKLALSDHNEFLLRKDLAVSKEHIKGLQATVAKKGKEALEYRAQAYRPTHKNRGPHMSGLRFMGNQIPAQAQSGHARSTEYQVDAGGRDSHTGGTRETVDEGNGQADRDIQRCTPMW